MQMTQAEIDKIVIDRLVRAVKMAYQKHHLNDTNIEWNELSDTLYSALVSTIGEDAFVEWMNSILGPRT